MYKKLQLPANATWTIKDILIVLAFVLVSGTSIYILILFLFGNTSTTFEIARYSGSILFVATPIFWLKKKYGLHKEALGLKNFKMTKILFLGFIVAITYSLIRIVFFKHIMVVAPKHASFIQILLVPISINGFASTVLTPVGEEIMDRGFIYGYLRGKVGVAFGLIVQALFFSISHIGFIQNTNAFYLIADRFIIGLILGFLYEETGSLYPSMICHGLINYISIISPAII